MPEPPSQSPDTARWDAVSEFNALTAAFLLLDIEPYPATHDRPLPAHVRALARELHEKLKPDRDTSEEWVKWNSLTRQEWMVSVQVGADRGCGLIKRRVPARVAARRPDGP